MPKLDDLMFRREHFPIPLEGPYRGRNDIEYYRLGDVVIPPYHPLMLETGIDEELLLSLFPEILSETFRDLGEVSGKMRELISPLADAVRHPWTGEILHGVGRGGGRFTEITFPILNGVKLTGHDGKTMALEFYGSSAEASINPALRKHPIQIMTPAILPQPLMDEYDIRDLEPEKAGKEPRWIETRHIWYTHNTEPLHDIFVKNLTIVYDNALVRKYSVVRGNYKPDGEGFVRFGEVAHHELEEQTQYAIRYTGLPEFQPVRDTYSDLGKGLRFKTDKATGGDYHVVEIHIDDIPEFVRRVRQYQIEHHIRNWS